MKFFIDFKKYGTDSKTAGQTNGNNISTSTSSMIIDPPIMVKVFSPEQTFSVIYGQDNAGKSREYKGFSKKVSAEQILFFVGVYYCFIKTTSISND